MAGPSIDLCSACLCFQHKASWQGTACTQRPGVQGKETGVAGTTVGSESKEVAVKGCSSSCCGGDLFWSPTAPRALAGHGMCLPALSTLQVLCFLTPLHILFSFMEQVDLSHPLGQAWVSNNMQSKTH